MTACAHMDNAERSFVSRCVYIACHVCVCVSQVPDDRVIFDPPLLRLETDAAHGYLSVLMHVYAYSTDPALRSEAASRSVKLCRATLVRFALGKDPARVQPDQQYMADARAKHQQLISAQTHNDAGFTSVNIGGVNIINARSAEAQRRAAQYASAVAAAAQGSTADRRSIIVGRTSTGLLVLMAAPSVEFAPFTPLINSTLVRAAAAAAAARIVRHTHTHTHAHRMRPHCAHATCRQSTRT